MKNSVETQGELEKLLGESLTGESLEKAKSLLSKLTNPRERLPDERKGLIHKFTIKGDMAVTVCPKCGYTISSKDTGCEGYIQVGRYPDGRLGELFLTLSKVGETRRGFADAWALAISLCIQYGVPFKTLADKYIGMTFEPFGYSSNPAIPRTSSIPDYIFRWLAGLK